MKEAGVNFFREKKKKGKGGRGEKEGSEMRLARIATWRGVRFFHLFRREEKGKKEKRGKEKGERRKERGKAATKVASIRARIACAHVSELQEKKEKERR